MADDTIPERPSNVPTTAVWDPEYAAYRVSDLRDGKRHGEARFYRAPDGTLACVCTFVDGLAQGSFTRYHPDGSVSRQGANKAGKLEGRIEFIRADGPSPENTVPDVCPPSVRRMVGIATGGDFYPYRFYAAEGREVAMDGSAIPTRPTDVHQDAMFLNGSWVHGLGIQADNRRHGLWRWWSTDGLLTMTTVYATGKMVEYEKLESGKRVEWRVMSDDGEIERCIFFDAETGAELDKERNPIPTRPVSLPASAVFDAWNNRWVAGARAKGGLPREGTFTWWMPDGELVKELTYEAGKVIASRTTSTDDDVVTMIETTFRPDGALATYRCTVGSRLHAEGTTTDGDTQYTFYGDDGAIAGTGVLDRDGVATGEWTFIEHGRTYTWDASSNPMPLHKPGAKPPRPRKVVINGDSQIGPLVANQLLLAPPADLPLGPALPGVDQVDWADLSCCYGKSGQHFPTFLRALTSPSPTLRRRGLAAIYSETLHQGTIYPLSAATVPFVARTLAAPACDRPALLEYVKDIAMAAQGFERQLDDLDEDDAATVSGTLDAVRGAWPELAPFLDAAEPAIRARAIVLGGIVGEPAAAGLRFATKDPDPAIAATAVRALIGLASTPSSEAEGFLASSSALDRAVAAITIAERLGAETPRRAIEVMIAALDDDDTMAAFRGLSFAEGSLRAYVALGLARSSAGPHRELIRSQTTRLAHLVGEVNIFDIQPVASGLLRICFGDGTPPFAPGTIDALEILSGLERLAGFANFHGVAGNYGLPGEPAELAELVAELRAADDPLVELAARFTAEDDDEVDEDAED